jgi:predicted acetyltransferase
MMDHRCQNIYISLEAFCSSLTFVDGANDYWATGNCNYYLLLLEGTIIQFITRLEKFKLLFTS